MCFGGGGSKGGSSSASTSGNGASTGTDPNALFQPMPNKDGTPKAPSEYLKPWATRGPRMGKDTGPDGSIMTRPADPSVKIKNPAYGKVMS